MPQLDINIIFIEFFFGFLLFWFLYFYNNKFIFPEINRTLKIRQIKIFDLKYKSIYLLNLYSLYEKINVFKYNANKNSGFFSLENILKNNLKKINLLGFILNSRLYISDIYKKNSFSSSVLTSKYYL